MYISRIYEIKLNDYNKFIIFIKMNIWIKKYIKKKNNKNLLYIHLRFVKEIRDFFAENSSNCYGVNCYGVANPLSLWSLSTMK